VSGLLYHDRDQFALAGAIKRLLDDEEYARSLGREARREARARHDPEAIAHQTSSVYGAVLGDSAA
jgi:glycosyltransferase involved in cell wall biosynthesis